MRACYCIIYRFGWKKNDESEVLGTKFGDMLCYDFSTTHRNSSYHIIPIVGSLSVI